MRRAIIIIIIIITARRISHPLLDCRPGLLRLLSVRTRLYVFDGLENLCRSVFTIPLVRWRQTLASRSGFRR
jgi:hypothetical protein